MVWCTRALVIPVYEYVSPVTPSDVDRLMSEYRLIEGYPYCVTTPNQSYTAWSVRYAYVLCSVLARFGFCG